MVGVEALIDAILITDRLRTQFTIDGSTRRSAPSTETFLRANTAINKAAHGLPLERSETAEALRSVSEFLAELHRLMGELGD